MIVERPDQLTAAWASDLLGVRVHGVTCTPVGTGQIGACYRLTLDSSHDAPRSLLVKLPAHDPQRRELLAGTYRSEVRFYAQLAKTVAIRVPHCYFAEYTGEGRQFTLVLQDAAPAEQGDQLLGCSRDQALDAVQNLAGLHGPRWCDPSLLQLPELSLNGSDDATMMAEFFDSAVQLFVTALADQLWPDTVHTLRSLPSVLASWALGRADRFALVHGDYRLDNLLFPPQQAAGALAVDWQTLSLALPARDLAFFTGTSLLPDQRAQHERDLVAAYHQRLLALGVRGYDLAQCWEDYRYGMLQGPLVTVFGQAYGTRTARGDRMFAAMANRSCAAITELNALALIDR